MSYSSLVESSHHRVQIQVPSSPLHPIPLNNNNNNNNNSNANKMTFGKSCDVSSGSAMELHALQKNRTSISLPSRRTTIRASLAFLNAEPSDTNNNNSGNKPPPPLFGLGRHTNGLPLRFSLNAGGFRVGMRQSYSRSHEKRCDTLRYVARHR